MEKFAGEMELAELHKKILFKAYEQAHSQASSVLLFALRWEELEEHFHGMRRSLEERARDVASREDALRSAWRWVEEREEAVRRKEMDLASAELRLEGCRDERREVESELARKRGALSECDTLIREKEEELRSLVRAAEERRGDYDSKKELEVLRREVELKEKTVGSVQAKLEKVSKSLELKLEKVSKSLELKSRELDAVQASIEGHNLELASIKQECESKMKQCDWMEKSIIECSQELEFRTSQLNSIQWRIRECSTDLERKKQHLCMLDVSIGERSRMFETQKEEWNVRCLELERECQRLHSIEESLEERSREMELRERTSGHSGVVAQYLKYPCGPVLASCLNSRSTTAFDGKKMQMFVYRHFQELNGVGNKVLEIIQTSVNAAKLVLDAMEGFYPQDSGNKDGPLDTGVIRRGCIFLLENLIRSSVQIMPQQREAAVKLAVECKGKLKFPPSPEQSLEVLGFLKLIEAYELASAFNANEIHELVNSVSWFQIAQELQQVLGSSAVPLGQRKCN
ncbi:hypothetical protein BT93_L3041 [Corymbia citriodora subsp. variegata]|uniref:FRIGIDA-like protein n=1 Tax=Corymbia citriodora subsp. variegata TaxID=360336 RepID=A0A8T0CVW6_CORYI|nr:hypothetical protein BT93_L3041 [Corymbia citriodora subsp. variegata]